MNNGDLSGRFEIVVGMSPIGVGFALFSAIFRRFKASKYLMPSTQYERLRSGPGLR